MRDLLSIGTSRGCEMIGTGIGLGLSGYRMAAASFNPSKISGLQLWLDAADSSTILQSSGGSAASADGDEIILAMKPTEPESYVTPPIRDSVGSAVTAPVQLANFVAAHSAVAAPMLRHGTLSTLITSAPIVEEPQMEPRVEPAVVTDDTSARGEIL